jgi:hypothetical protein
MPGRRFRCYRCGAIILHARDATVVETCRPDGTTWSPATLCPECATAHDRFLRTRPGGMAGFSDPPMVTVTR